MSRLRIIFAATIAAAGLALAALHAPASAAPAPFGEHCVEYVGIGSATPKLTCFSTFADATSYATSGAVQLPKDATTVTQAQLDAGYARAAAAGIVIQAVTIGISYDGTGNTGASRTHTRDSGCDSDPGREWWGDLPDDWNDRIGSAVGRSGCTGRYYEHTVNANTGGGDRVLTPWSGGALNNETSFIEWF
jgi:hypothetical protein